MEAHRQLEELSLDRATMEIKERHGQSNYAQTCLRRQMVHTTS